MVRRTLILLLISFLNFGFIQTRTQDGKAVRWFGIGRLPLVGNWVNQSGLSDSQVFSSITKALDRWKRAGRGSVQFDYWQGSDSSTYETSSNYNGLSSFYFASRAGGAGMSAGVIGLTQVWYDTNSGEILETDVTLNDVHFQFTTDPRDTTGTGSGMSSGRRVFVENVITHELGHAYGLSHSGNLQSTMLFAESPEQAYLSCDDQVGIQSIYPGSDTGARGIIDGRVIAPSGARVFGAHIAAISRKRGVILATGMTDASGYFRIDGLEEGAYYIMVEPYKVDGSSLSSFYNGINSNVCSGRAFSRTFLKNGYDLIPVGVSASRTSGAGDIEVSCNTQGDAQILSQSNFASAESIFDGNNESGVGFVSNVTSASYVKLENISGSLKLRAVSYSAYSPVRVQLKLYNSSGVLVNTQTQESSYVGRSGFINYDAALSVGALPQGTYNLQITPINVSSQLYPASSYGLENTGFIMIVGEPNASAAALAGVLPDSARCQMSEGDPGYRSPGGAPERHSAGGGGSNNKDEEEGGFCGTIRDAKLPPPNMSGNQIVAWFLPWILMAMTPRLLRTRRMTVNLYR